MDKIETSYKGYKIEHDIDYDKKEKWVLKDDDDTSVYEHASLAAVKEYVDRLNKKGFKTFTILYDSGWGNNKGYIRHTVTSIDDQGDYWIKNDEGRRQKIRPGNAVVDSPENATLIQEIRAVEAEEDKLQKRRHALEKKLKRHGKNDD
jgi:hypothetical protein